MYSRLLVGFLAVVSSVGISSAEKHQSCSNKCITDGEVTYLVNGFRKIISESPVNRTLAAEIIVQDFVSISDSVNFVDQVPLNTTLTHSLPQLLEQESRLPAVGSVKDLYIAHNCETITWYFEFATKPLPTRGIAILFVGENRRIWKAYREANVGATLVAMGRPECRGDFGWSVGREGVEGGRSGCG
ncbi:hypothetical protein PRZ48_010953 [Zasmidium cellare]|uniref:NTF2-like domain-containing protein n=1 Tax=Zasmidium cellare TaxID=395010 RepID=A0ABR0EAM4_ZASCE|nr:hypothetical protein PRZ48_010953 [Zasmidium cellare]